MGFNGSGTWVRAFNWVNDKIQGINITASRMDGDSNDFAAGFNNCVTRDNQGPPTASLNPGSDAAFDLGAPSRQWRNAYLSGTSKSVDDLQPTLRIIKATSQAVTNSATAVADSQLSFIPVAVGSYVIDVRMIFSANAAAGPGGFKVGLYATFVNANCQAITAMGWVNSNTPTFANGSFATLATNTPTYSVNTIAIGVGANWIHMTGTLNILNLTGSPVIGVNWCQNTATVGGTLTAETPCYMHVTRVS